MTDLPDGWGSRPLSEVLEESIGGIWGSEPGSAEVDVSVLRVTEMKADGRLEPSTAARRSVSTKQVTSRKLRVGDIILEKSGGGPKSPVGRVGIIDSTTAGYLFSNFMQLLRPATEMVQPDFLFQFLVYFQATGQTAPMQTATTNIRNIKMPDYLASGVPLPPLVEQQRIVEILEEQFSHLDAALASIRTVREKAKAFRRSLLQAAFSGELSEGGTTGWRTLSVSSLGKWNTGKTPSTKFPDNFGHDIPFVTPADLSEEIKIASFRRNLSFKGASQSRVITAPAMLLVCIGATLGKVGWVERSVTTNQQINTLEPNTEVVQVEFATYLFSSSKIQTLLWATSSSTTLPLLNKSSLLGLEVTLPPVSEQSRLVGILGEQFSRLDAALAITNQLEARISSERRSLLHAAFSGALTEQWRTTQNG